MMALQHLVLPLMLIWRILPASHAVCVGVRVMKGIMMHVIRTFVIMRVISDDADHDSTRDHQDHVISYHTKDDSARHHHARHMQ